MQFNSFIFLFAFLPILLVAYYLLGKIHDRIGKIVLIAASIFFYVYTDISAFTVLGISLVVNFCFALLIAKVKTKKLFMLLPVPINVALLLVFKYSGFVVSNLNALLGTQLSFRELILPAGISFFTFQQIAYIVAVYRNEIEKVDVLDYAVYILYFPKLLMGPLAEPADFISQLNDPQRKKWNPDNIASGLKIFSFGFFKTVFIASTLAKAVTWGFESPGRATSMDWILIMLCYTFEIYFDFSGYCDMAVGVSQMLNITLPINFDSPYKAQSVRDFWKRWHISLTKFLTKYIYIPLGGNRKGMFFTCLNTLVVFLISGIWHGANWTFILWGGLHGALCVFERLTENSRKKIFEPVRWFLTFAAINVLWLLFRADSVRQWADILRTIVSFGNTGVSDGLLEIFVLPEISAFMHSASKLTVLYDSIRGFSMNLFMVFAFAICLLPENNYKNLKKYTWFGMVLAAICFVWGIVCLREETIFIYSNF